MKQYQFNDVVYMKKKNAIQVENREKESVGTIGKADISGCEKRSVVSFTAHKGSEIKIGIKKRNITNLLVATYIIKTEEKTYFLKDKPGNSLLYFCVVGNIDGQDIRIEENWSSEIEVKIDIFTSLLTKQMNSRLRQRYSLDRKSKTPDSNQVAISYGVFFLEKKKQ